MFSIREEEPPKVSSRPARLVTSRVPFRVRHILLAIESDDRGSRAIEYAKRLARLCDCKLTLMSVYRVKYGFELIPDLEAVTLMEQEMEQAFQYLEGLTAQIRQKFPRCDACFRAGHPDDEISWMVSALDIDLVLIGKHSQQSPRNNSGGISETTIMQRTGCPVIVVQEERRNR
jgi:nucleotide-binding universal stress UspA family protein